MATPRSQLVDPELALHYHLISRCVRRSWLCGRDPQTGKNYNHRKTWLKSRLLHLAQYFAVEVDAYSILSNHFHLVVFHDPKACERWSVEEVAYRWSEAFPSRSLTGQPEDIEALKAIQRDLLMAHPDLIARARKCLGSMSGFMKHLKQPIAWRANREDGCRGHFFESRFYSGALLGEEAVLAAMAYVDLNPVRAKIAKSIEECRDSSISQRLKMMTNSRERLEEVLKPLVSGLSTGESNVENPRISMTLKTYVDHLRILIDNTTAQNDKQRVWINHVATIKKRQRAYGFATELKHWIDRRGWKHLGVPLIG